MNKRESLKKTGFSMNNRSCLLESTQKTALSRTVALYKNEKDAIVNYEYFKKLKANVSGIRQNNIDSIEPLWKQAITAFECNGVIVHRVANAIEARAAFVNITKEHDRIVSAKSNLIDEVGLRTVRRIFPTDIGEWIIHKLGLPKCHPVFPAAYVPFDKVKRMLSKRGIVVDTPDDAVKSIRNIIYGDILSGDVGITGANIVTAEGHIVIAENEGNIALVTHLPRKHITFVALNRISTTLEEAMTIVKSLSLVGGPQKNTSYINVISSSSATRDINDAVVKGVHGPREVHLVIVDNGRSEIAADLKMRSSLKCIGCGSCMYYCPAYREKGSGFGAIHPGGIGLLLSSFMANTNESLFDCFGCEICDDICPVGVETFANIKQLRRKNENLINRNIRDSIMNKGNAVEESETWEIQ